MSELDDLEREFGSDEPWERKRRMTNKLIRSGKAHRERCVQRGRRYMRRNSRFMSEVSPSEPYDPSKHHDH